VRNKEERKKKERSVGACVRSSCVYFIDVDTIALDLLLSFSSLFFILCHPQKKTQEKSKKQKGKKGEKRAMPSLTFVLWFILLLVVVCVVVAESQGTQVGSESASENRWQSGARALGVQAQQVGARARVGAAIVARAAQGQVVEWSDVARVRAVQSLREGSVMAQSALKKATAWIKHTSETAGEAVVNAAATAMMSSHVCRVPEPRGVGVLDGDYGSIWLSKWIGGLGNCMHQVAFVCSLAERFNLEVILPSRWMGTHLFAPYRRVSFGNERSDTRALQSQLDSQTTTAEIQTTLRGSRWTYVCMDNRVDPFFLPLRADNGLVQRHVVMYDLFAYNQAMFNQMDASFLRERVFAFSDDVRALQVYQTWEARRRTYTAFHVRRGDSVNPSLHWYLQVSVPSYERALAHFEPNTHREDVVVVSDDTVLRSYRSSLKPSLGWLIDPKLGDAAATKARVLASDRGKKNWHTAVDGQTYFLPPASEWSFNNNLDCTEDLLALYFARTVFRANSSLSFWFALLGGSDVYSPVVSHYQVHGVVKKPSYEIDFAHNNTEHWLASNPTTFTLKNARAEKT
jgi:hypothetical protein